MGVIPSYMIKMSHYLNEKLGMKLLSVPSILQLSANNPSLWRGTKLIEMITVWMLLLM